MVIERYFACLCQRNYKIFASIRGPVFFYRDPVRLRILPLRIHQIVTREIDVHRDSQQREDKWALEKEQLTAQYTNLLTEKGQLEKTDPCIDAGT